MSISKSNPVWFRIAWPFPNRSFARRQSCLSQTTTSSGSNAKETEGGRTANGGGIGPRLLIAAPGPVLPSPPSADHLDRAVLLVTLSGTKWSRRVWLRRRQSLGPGMGPSNCRQIATSRIPSGSANHDLFDAGFLHGTSLQSERQCGCGRLTCHHLPIAPTEGRAVSVRPYPWRRV